jgi:hypothetical protein
MQVDSKPEELDNVDREIVRLKIEAEALKKRPTPPRRTGSALEKELADLGGALRRDHGALALREGQARPRRGAEEEA